MIIELVGTDISTPIESGEVEVLVDNQYLDWWSNSTEQDLYKDLTKETVQMYGKDIVYLPRVMRRDDVLYNEDILSKFEEIFVIRAFCVNVNGWDGLGNILGKFGIKTKDKLTLQVSIETFHEVFANVQPPMTRPMEGDLVYVPRPVDALFEVTFVEHEKAEGGAQFYPLGKPHYYELQMELHTYNQEAFDHATVAINNLKL